MAGTPTFTTIPDRTPLILIQTQAFRDSKPRLLCFGGTSRRLTAARQTRRRRRWEARDYCLGLLRSPKVWRVHADERPLLPALFEQGAHGTKQTPSGGARAVHHIESPAMVSLCRMCNVREI